MQFFKGLIRASTPQPTAEPDARALEFDETWVKTLRVFEKMVGLGTIRINLTHPRTKGPLKPHEGLNATFAEWKKIQSPWDQRVFIFDFLMNDMGFRKAMKVWQIANALTAMRGPDKALKLLQDNPQPETTSEDYAAHCAAFARAFFGLQQPVTALEWAKKAFEHDSAAYKLIYADGLYLTGECDAADHLYTELMGESKSDETDETIPNMFAKLFARDTGVVPSPVVALSIAEKLANPDQAAEFWQFAEADYYDSSFFRMHHAYHLLKAGQTERALAKLVALVQEMPWLREPSINLDILFKQLDPTGSKFMPEFQAQLRQRIQENGWTTEGMNLMQVDLKASGSGTTSAPS